MVMTQTALVLIDIQEGFHEPAWGPRNCPHFEETVSDLISWWRRIGGCVIHVQHLSSTADSPLAVGKQGTAFMHCAEPESGEKVFRKQVNSAFIGTGLEGYLREHRFSTLVFAGLTSDHCVSTSVRMAKNLGFSPLVLTDATATFERISHDGQRFSADLVHSVSLASLNREFARVLDVEGLRKAVEEEEIP